MLDLNNINLEICFLTIVPNAWSVFFLCQMVKHYTDRVFISMKLWFSSTAVSRTWSLNPVETLSWRADRTEVSMADGTAGPWGSLLSVTRRTFLVHLSVSLQTTTTPREGFIRPPLYFCVMSTWPLQLVVQRLSVHLLQDSFSFEPFCRQIGQYSLQQQICPQTLPQCWWLLRCTQQVIIVALSLCPDRIFGRL